MVTDKKSKKQQSDKIVRGVDKKAHAKRIGGEISSKRRTKERWR